MSHEASERLADAGLHWVRTSTEHPETVVLIHAVGYDLTYWDRQIEALRAEYNVVAFDLPGHGSSPKEPEGWSFDRAAQRIAALIETVSTGPVHLVGISFGGMLAQATVLARPELIRTLSLIGTASTFPETAREGMRARAQVIRSGGMAAVLQSSLERWFTPELRSRRPDIMDRVSKTLLGDDAETQAAIWDLIAGFDVHNRLREIKCPTLVLVGELDASTPPSAAKALAEGILGAKMIVVPHAAHIVTVEAPEAVNVEILSFLKASVK